ncbi:HalOD1 output domain-containing protein [Natrinema sp. DC36]|uniref:HalOD1 output domain-containing protein n=1 Tax=Natrinema sp. DC36 TaxID=2878680 RepID=UPI001CF00B17|nr:HalOD1 output domain-containing protein [Natrinema sp. DC36]
MMRTDVVTNVVKAVAAQDEVEPGELDSLYEYIDPEILEKVYEQEKGDWTFTFQYSDPQVTLTHEEQIFVDGVLHTPSVSRGSK